MPDLPIVPPTEPGDAAIDRPASPAAAAGADVDVARRQFFRRFAGDMVNTAATVVGAAQALRETSTLAAQAILHPASGAATLAGSAAARADAELMAAPTAPGAEGPDGGHAPAGFRTPFRYGEADDVLLVIDQRRLPGELVEVEVRSARDASAAIRDMVVRGAPAIGQVAAVGLALTAHQARQLDPYARRATLRGSAAALIAARPTAVNLRWAVDRLMARYDAIGGAEADGLAIAQVLREEADAIVWEATVDHGRLADFGLAELERPEDRPLQLLTHCNTGPLACGQFGTALGVVQAAHNAGWPLHVWVDETRPYLQGARLTAWELKQAGVPHTLVADVAAGFLISRGEVDAVLVGADRIAANGDTANKVGTYTLAVLAARHAVPFYVVAPLSSVDPGMADGAAIPIEERPADEVLFVQGRPIAPPDTAARNPAFDVTPAALISAIVTEEGALRAPLGSALESAFERRRARRAAEPSPFRRAPAGDQGTELRPGQAHGARA